MVAAHSIQVLTCLNRGGVPGIAAMAVFLDPSLFSLFGLPPTR